MDLFEFLSFIKRERCPLLLSIPIENPKLSLVHELNSLVCFVDKCRVVDNRSEHFQAYVPVCILNNFLSVINKNLAA